MSIYSYPLERHVLAGVIKNPKIFPDIDRFVSEKDFYSDVHSTIFCVVRDTLVNGEKIDKILVANKIKNLIPSALFPEHETDLASSALVTCLGKRLEFAISIDNGVMHMLSLAKVPMISLFGPTDSEKFAPEYNNSISLDSKKLYNTKNLSAITVKDVLNAAKQLLNY